MEKRHTRSLGPVSKVLADLKYQSDKDKKLNRVFQASGVVLNVKDGITQVSNMRNAFLGETVWVKSKLTGDEYRGLVIGLREEYAEVVLFEGLTAVSEGDAVTKSNSPIGVLVSDKLFGRAVDPLGRSIDGKAIYSADDDISTYRYQAFFNNAPAILERDPVNESLATGYKGVDSLIPIGLGQRELVIGDRKTGKTSLLIDTIINQKGTNVKCVYVMIGQKKAELARLLKDLRNHQALDHTIIVSADSAQPAGLQYVAAYAGVSIADYFRLKGLDVIVVLDDLSKHADAYRQMSLLLRRPPGREAFPGDVFYLHSRILERAANTKRRNAIGPKQGSITAFPVIETQAGDVSAYIPTNVISITDGQIFLDKVLFNKGVRPAINVGLSVSRVGSAAQTKAMKKVAGTLKLELAQFREIAAFAQFGSDLDPTTQSQLHRGARLAEILKQKKHAPLSLDEEVLIIYAAVHGFLDDIELSDIQDYEKKLIAHVKKHHAALLLTIKLSREINTDTEFFLRTCVQYFTHLYKKLRVQFELTTTSGVAEVEE
jgi:F-type H+-transporting ATPase subunit alpha